jgi:phage FluMu protein Com
MKTLKCPHCKKVFFDISADICPVCKKNLNETDFNIFRELFGEDGPFRKVDKDES